ncbi:MAG TPA: XRE family transcriptional regulator [bacterium]|nr:XRE family transcriptional regulator [bacterium]
MTKKQKYKDDIFDKVTRRKKDIDDRQDTVDRRMKNALREAEAAQLRAADAILMENYKAKEKETNLPCDQDLRRKVLASCEKIGLIPEYHEELPIIDLKTFNQYRKRLYIMVMTDPTYHCPCCGECKTKLSEWYVQPKINLRILKLDLYMNRQPQRKVMCRSCVRAFGWKGKPIVEKFTNYILFKSIIRYYKIDATDLCRKRSSASCSVKEFAGIVGWTQWYQYRMENGSVPNLNEKAMKDLITAFNRLKISIPLDIWGRAKDRFVPDGKAIGRLRFLKGMSKRQFGTRAGWTGNYQNQIENGKKKTINKRTMDIITSILRTD